MSYTTVLKFFKKEVLWDTYHKADFTNRNTTKGARTFSFVLLFTLLALQGIVCYTFWM